MGHEPMYRELYAAKPNFLSTTMETLRGTGKASNEKQLELDKCFPCCSGDIQNLTFHRNKTDLKKEEGASTHAPRKNPRKPQPTHERVNCFLVA